MRQMIGISFTAPSAPVTTAVIFWRGLRLPVRPLIETVSSPLSPSDCQLAPASAKTKGTTPMPTRFERWMRSKLWAITALTPSKVVPLAAQSREEPLPYSMPPKITNGTFSFWYFIEAS